MKSQIELTTEEEYQLLLQDHRDFVRKKYEVGLTRQEVRRWTLLKWKIDRIEEAKNGLQLDVMKAICSVQEDLASQITNFKSDVEQVLGRKK